MNTDVKRAAGIVRQIADSWQNVLSGLGSSRDKGNARFARVCAGPILDRTTLAEAYRSMWLVRRVVNAVPEDAVRRGFGEGNEPDKLTEFMRLNHARYAEGALLRACNLGRLMGGAGIYVGYANGGADLLSPPAAGAEVAFLEVFHRFELQGVEHSRVRDTSDPRHGQPDLWQVIGQNRTGLTFHHTRMIRFPGQPRADEFEATTQTDRDWWDSILQSLWEDLIRYGMFWQGVSHLMQISSVGVLKIAGLIDMLASKNTEDAEARIDLLNESLSITRLMMLDAKHAEEYHREAVSFADVPGLLQELQLATAGAVGMPVTKLFGRAPAGMNATGESDLTNWYDTVDTWREMVLKPRAEALISACERRAVKIEWPALWEPTERECAEVRQIKVATADTLWKMGVASEDEIRSALHDGVPLEEKLAGAAPEPPPAPVLPGAQPGAEQDDPIAEAQALFDAKRHDVSEFWDKSSDQLIAAAHAKLAKANAKLQRQLTRYQTTVAKNEPKLAKHLAKPVDEQDEDAINTLRDQPAERLAEAFAVYVEEAQAASDDIDVEVDSIDDNPDAGDPQGQQERRAKLAAVSKEYAALSETAAEAAESMYDGAGNVDTGKVREVAAKALQQGPRGGMFYISTKGTKVYRGRGLTDSTIERIADELEARVRR
jgi:phage-related protein (TIGR01555 family)